MELDGFAPVLYNYSVAMNKYSDAKAARQAALLEAVGVEALATQNELVAALKRRGVKATQVSVSRDVAELGLVKVSGVYRAAGPAEPDPVRSHVKRLAPAGPNLLVVHCETGTAQRVGLAIDALRLPEVAGTIAGDDTVFVALPSGSAQKRALQLLAARMKP